MMKKPKTIQDLIYSGLGDSQTTNTKKDQLLMSGMVKGKTMTMNLRDPRKKVFPLNSSLL